MNEWMNGCKKNQLPLFVCCSLSVVYLMATSHQLEASFSKPSLVRSRTMAPHLFKQSLEIIAGQRGQTQPLKIKFQIGKREMRLTDWISRLLCDPFVGGPVLKFNPNQAHAKWCLIWRIVSCSDGSPVYLQTCLRASLCLPHPI